MVRTSSRTLEEARRHSRELKKTRGRSTTTALLAQEHLMTTERTFEKTEEENCLGFAVTLYHSTLVTSL